jgi:hypothetical protein
MVSPKTVWIAVVASAAGILFAAWLLGGWGGASTIRAVDDIGLLIFALFAATCAGLAATAARDRQRTAWVCLAAGIPHRRDGLTADEWLPHDRSVPTATDNTSSATLA